MATADEEGGEEEGRGGRGEEEEEEEGEEEEEEEEELMEEKVGLEAENGEEDCLTLSESDLSSALFSRIARMCSGSIRRILSLSIPSWLSFR